jgi:O-antigen ligase
MTNAKAVSAAPIDFSSVDRLEQTGLLALIGVAAALHFSIAAAQSLLAIAILCWIALVVIRRERVEVPRFFVPLLGLAALTLVSAAYSPHRLASFADSKQLLLYLIVPMAYRFATGQRGTLILTVIVTVGATSAAIGIFQYGILHYDNLGLRPRGVLGHYMTYSGLLMLVMGVAMAQVVFGGRERIWAMLVMPALAVAIAVTFTRSAMVGACAAAAMLLALKDYRLVAILPVAAAIFLAVAPSGLTARFVSMFDLKDPTNRDRVAMLSEGARMIRSRPLVGVGPNMVEVVYPQYRGPDAVERINPHLHNVPLQIAAERGLPALAFWLVFVGTVLYDLAFRASGQPVLRAAGSAAVIAMLAAGMFEHNFGDSEFLMLFLLLITLPFAAGRVTPLASAATSASRA